MWACYEGHKEVVGLLLDAGADVNIRSHIVSEIYLSWKCSCDILEH